jgi:hypothetical protein
VERLRLLDVVALGPGDFEIKYPPLHDLAASENPVLRRLHDALLYLAPEPHRNTFIKPFHREQTAEFCSSCHKVHLDVPANGAELLVRVSAYMDPWGATEPMNWWTLINRTRAIEKIAYVVAANQGASLRHYPPYSWPGGSQIVDFDGRILAEASPEPGERIVVAPVDVSALRHERQTRVGHHMIAYLRTEAYEVYRTHSYAPRPSQDVELSYEENVRRIEAAKQEVERRQLEAALPGPRAATT